MSFRVRRASLLLFVFALPGSALPLGSTAQPPARNFSIALDLWAAKLAFSADDRVLHAIGTSPGPSETQHFRAITYDAATGAVLNTIDLQRGSLLLSTTSDGRRAIVSTGGGSGGHIELSLVDTETGKSEPIPSAWYEPADDETDAELSGDGRLISIYSESGSENQPLTVTVYTWPGKTKVAKRTSGFLAAGGVFGGGITPDGNAVAFDSNREGSKLVDLKTGREMARFGSDSVRSPKGDWEVELPDIGYKDERAPRAILIKDGATGKGRGRINVPVPDDVAYGQMSGVFCGVTNRFVLSSGHAVAVYAIPSGALIASFPAESWRDAAAKDPTRTSVACSPTASRVAILSGTSLTLHTLK